MNNVANPLNHSFLNVLVNYYIYLPTIHRIERYYNLLKKTVCSGH